MVAIRVMGFEVKGGSGVYIDTNLVMSMALAMEMVVGFVKPWDMHRLT